MAEVSNSDIEAAKPDVRYWLGQIEASQKWHHDWHERGKQVVERYMDKRPEGSSNALDAAAGHKMNTLWSNVETIKPALYAKAPTPAIQRRFRDRDPVGRWAATVLERCEAYELDAYDDDYNYRQAVQDYLLPGRGQVWVNYEPTIAGGQDLRNQHITWECCKVRHLHWKDFITNPARSWDEVWWVAKREYLTEDEAKAQRLDVKKLSFTDQPDQTNAHDGADQAQRVRKAAVWEIWSKTHGKVFFVSKNCPELLRDAVPPGLKLQGFFPCPRPLTATTSTDSIIPQPDFVLYQNQAAEIDRMTQRINLLTKALRVAGVYDASQESLGRLLEDTESNILVPCPTFAVLASQGGIEGSISFFPMKEVIAALKQCYESRELAKAAMYEITGISDIVRGASDAQETATAQQIKSQWGGLRIRDRQKEVQRFCRDVMRIKAEIHAEQFQQETLRSMSNVPLADEATKKQLQMRAQAQEAAQQNPQAAQQAVAAMPQLQALAQPLSQHEQTMLKEPSWEQVMKLLRDDKLRGFSVDVETDSTIQPDEQAEKESRTEFVTAVTTFMEGWGPMVQQQPKLAPLAGELLTFATRAFPAADSLQTVIEETIETLENMPPAQAPEDHAGQAAIQMVQVKDQERQDRMAVEQAKVASAGQVEQLKAQAQIQLEDMRLQHEAQMRQMEQAHTERMEAAKLQSEQTFARWEAELKASTAIEVAMIGAQQNEGGPAVKATNEASETITKGLGEGIQQIMDAVNASVDRHSEAMDQLGALLKQASGPKRIVRGPDGRAIGVEPVTIQ